MVALVSGTILSSGTILQPRHRWALCCLKLAKDRVIRKLILELQGDIFFFKVPNHMEGMVRSSTQLQELNWLFFFQGPSVLYLVLKTEAKFRVQSGAPSRSFAAHTTCLIRLLSYVCFLGLIVIYGEITKFAPFGYSK